MVGALGHVVFVLCGFLEWCVLEPFLLGPEHWPSFVGAVAAKQGFGFPPFQSPSYA